MSRRISQSLSLLLLVTTTGPCCRVVDSALAPFGDLDPLLVVDSADLTLKQVHVVTRHGSRYPLEKDSVIERTPGTLTYKGEEQMTELGRFLKERYGGTLASIGGNYDATRVKLMSSAFDRTIVSALALAAGIWDETKRDPMNEASGAMRQNVAVYSQEVQDDVTIRAYDKCPRFHHDQRQMYESPIWMGKEAENINLLRKLAAVPAFRHYAAFSYNGAEPPKIALQDLYNVYDLITVAMTECNVNTARLACLNIPLANEVGQTCSPEQKLQIEQSMSKACTSLEFTVEEVLAPFDSGAELQTMLELVHEAELLKYGSNLAGKYVGGNLLMQILDSMVEDKYISQTFYLYSAHYPTILGIFAAMDNIAPMAVNVIPAYASALIFELYESTVSKEKFLKVHYRTLNDDSESGDMQMISNVPLGNACGSESPFCLVNTMYRYVSQDLDALNWCERCGNYDAATCARDAVYECEDQAVGWIIGCLFIGLFVGAFLPRFCAWCCCGCGKNRSEQEKEEQQALAEPAVEENAGNNNNNSDDGNEESASDFVNHHTTSTSSSVRSRGGAAVEEATFA